MQRINPIEESDDKKRLMGQAQQRLYLEDQVVQVQAQQAQVALVQVVLVQPHRP